MLFAAKISVDCVNYVTTCIHVLAMNILTEFTYATISTCVLLSNSKEICYKIKKE